MSLPDNYECEGQMTIAQFLEGTELPEKCYTCARHCPPRWPCLIYKEPPRSCEFWKSKEGMHHERKHIHKR